jgi:hypothetical protein
MALSEGEITRILDRLRDGHVVRHEHSGGRYRRAWLHRDGAWTIEDWEEGSDFTTQLSEAEMRTSIAAGPEELFLRLLGP